MGGGNAQNSKMVCEKKLEKPKAAGKGTLKSSLQQLQNDVGVLSRVTRSDLKNLLSDLECRKKIRINFVIVRSFHLLPICHHVMLLCLSLFMSVIGFLQSLSINEFLKPASGEKYFNPGGLGQGRGARGGDDECCNSYEEVREAYRRKSWGMTNPDLIDQCKREGFAQKIKDKEGEGCNIYGSVEVNNVAGNFYLIKSFHQSSIFIPDLLAFQEDSYNISHKINKLAFGEY
ncbi:hypothetical protein L1887_35206 [Cichorium endivia]|nr:hypothetical protein L1887_35206 [Cichorium endivia]